MTRGYVCCWRGILLPILLLIVGLMFVMTESAWLFGQGRVYPVHDGTASAVQGLMFVAWSVGLHLRHSWSNVPRFAATADVLGVGAYVMAGAFAVWFIYLCVRYVFG